MYWESHGVLFVDCKIQHTKAKQQLAKLSHDVESFTTCTLCRGLKRCVHVSVCMYVCKFLHVSMSICMHVYTFVCVCMCV